MHEKHLRLQDAEIIRRRADEYHNDRIGRAYKGRHPLRSLVPKPDSILLRTNDYLCLANDPRIIDAEVRALQKWGHGDAISRVWAHHVSSPLNEFERRVAKLMGAEDGVLFASGYVANIGLIQALCRSDTPVYIDLMAHTSMWEGIVSAKAIQRPFRHNDVEHLSRQIQKGGPGVIAIDALYSTNGDMAPLAQIVDVAEQTGCALVVDETHSFGTFGQDGAGLVASLNLSDRVPFRTIGFSKAVPCRGGIVVCSSRNAEMVRYEALPSIFSTSVMPHEVACYDAVLDIFASEPWRRDRLHQTHARLRGELLELGYNVLDCKAQILSL